mmetsp:Transcript_9400/g.18322  ORF Transcript_9400/g.18322 Transcript_9400/m.18322 type:complete len:333 (-) Transcript_9400:162-1160(-)
MKVEALEVFTIFAPSRDVDSDAGVRAEDFDREVPVKKLYLIVALLSQKLPNSVLCLLKRRVLKSVSNVLLEATCSFATAVKENEQVFHVRFTRPLKVERIARGSLQVGRDRLWFVFPLSFRHRLLHLQSRSVVHPHVQGTRVGTLVGVGFVSGHFDAVQHHLAPRVSEFCPIVQPDVLAVFHWCERGTHYVMPRSRLHEFRHPDGDHLHKRIQVLQLAEGAHKPRRNLRLSEPWRGESHAGKVHFLVALCALDEPIRPRRVFADAAPDPGGTYRPPSSSTACGGCGVGCPLLRWLHLTTLLLLGTLSLCRWWWLGLKLTGLLVLDLHLLLHG